jgi:osmotically-inducible protein OsmY
MVGLKLGLCLITLTLPLAFGGCAGALLVGGLAGVAVGGYAAAQERGVAGAVSDLHIETNVESVFAATHPGLKDGITTTVYQGRVLLTGTVPTPQMKTRAVEVASRVSGIKALYDDIEVAPSRAAWDATNDAWITARIRSELMLDPDIRSGNYTIDTQKGSVYLIGSARSQAELERATRSARYIPGVTRVVTYIELRPGAPVAQQPTPSVAPARSSTGSQSPQVPERGHDHRGWMDDGRRRKPGAKHDDRHPS